MLASTVSVPNPSRANDALLRFTVWYLVCILWNLVHQIVKIDLQQSRPWCTRSYFLASLEEVKGCVRSSVARNMMMLMLKFISTNSSFFFWWALPGWLGCSGWPLVKKTSTFFRYLNVWQCCFFCSWVANQWQQVVIVKSLICHLFWWYIFCGWWYFRKWSTWWAVRGASQPSFET